MFAISVEKLKPSKTVELPPSYSWEQVQIARRKMHGAESYAKLKVRTLSKLERYRLNQRQVPYLPLKVRASS